ncbi:uncharacterized protein METZ01_LOCUS177131 [marine metagenome]|uniref:Uncharacterized protein n=1 Tax=marine metagenome TaxID=408172 RepID=A0A382CG55_9ZZZZ
MPSQLAYHEPYQALCAPSVVTYQNFYVLPVLAQRSSFPLTLGPSGSFTSTSMSAKGPSRSEFSQPVPYHVLGQVHGNMAPPVMDGNGQSNHVWHNHRGT